MSPYARGALAVLAPSAGLMLYMGLALWNVPRGTSHSSHARRFIYILSDHETRVRSQNGDTLVFSRDTCTVVVILK